MIPRPQQHLIAYAEDQAREIDREQAEAKRERFGVFGDQDLPRGKSSMTTEEITALRVAAYDTREWNALAKERS